MEPTVGREKLAIQKLTETTPDAAAIQAFLGRHQFPIVEESSVTFVFVGAVDFVNLRHWVLGLPSTQALVRVPNTDLWWLTIELPDRSRVEYKFEVIRQGHGDLVHDPLNPHLARDPFGANSVAHSKGYQIPEWTRHDSEARHGSIEGVVIESRHLGRKMVSKLYLPARFRKTRRYPLLIVHDGTDYIHYSGMKVVLDNLIHRLEIPDMVVAFSDPGDRLREYAAGENHSRYITEELVPRIEGLLPVGGKPAARGLMGASFGAVAAFATAHRSPGFYGRLLLQSGSFAFTDIGSNSKRGPLFDPIVTFMNHYRGNPTVVAEKLFVSCGIYEPLIYENRSLMPMLAGTGMDLRYVEARDGHNWENWRDRLREGLSWLFPGPLMLVYE